MVNKLIPFVTMALLLVTGSCKPKADLPADAGTGSPEEIAAPVEKVAEGLPKVTLIEESGRQFSATTLPPNAILIFFSSDCDHCQREAADIEKNLSGFANYSLYFISMNPFPEMRKFAEKYRINTQANIQFLRADGKSVFDSFGSIETPTIFVYDKNKKLVRRFDGETPVDKILKIL